MKKVNCLSVGGVMVAAIVCLLFVGQVARADYVIGKPIFVPNVNSDFSDDAAQISRDGLELYLSSKREGGSVNTWVSRRASIDAPWSIPVKLNIAGADSFPSPSTDGLELYYGANGNISVLTRASKEDPWGDSMKLGSTVNSENDWDAQPCISADGLSLYFMSTRFASKNNEILVATRPSKNDPWGEPTQLGPNINSNQFEYSPFISADGLSLLFSRGAATADIYISRRAATTEPWGVAELLASVNSGGTNISASFSDNDSTIYFARGSNLFTPDFNIWQADVVPIVDFNGDERVDNEDLLILIDHWGQNEPSVDIGPTSWGDGLVDAQDLEVLMHYWGQDASLIAHWKLDETGGDLAYDSEGENDAVVMGDALWERRAGQVDGALQFDGNSTYVSTHFILNSTEPPFSVFAWIKGGEPGQSIVSQSGGADWLAADSAEGKLSTSLAPPLAGRFPVPTPPLVSDIVITDGNWHRVGLVWDELDRILYVDDVEVARDSVGRPESSEGDLYLGTGSDRVPGTFWSGLIDDVRVYDRVVKP